MTTPIAAGPLDRRVSPPALQKQVSPNGAEIWNWAARMSEHAQLLHERRTLVEDIRRARTECGSCSHWMTRNCPMEKHSNQTGRSTGPSNQAFKCVKFDMSQHIEKFIVTKQGRLDEVHELLKRANVIAQGREHSERPAGAEG